MDAVLIVGAGRLQVPMMTEAKGLGLGVIATDANPDAPGVRMADEFYPIDTYDVPGHQLLGHMLADHHHWNLLGVTTCGSDTAPSVAAASQAAGVRGIPLAIAQRTHDKYQSRLACEAAALTLLYQPQWAYLTMDAPCEEVVRAITEGPHFPCIMKPLEQRASRGVSICRQEHEVLHGVRRALTYGDAYLIEALLEGSEHSIELILGNNQETLWANIVDRYFDYGSGIPIERGHVNPTCLDEHAQQQLLLMALATARALGVTWGAWKIDAMMTAEGPKMLECTARLSGGWDCQWSSPATNRHPMRTLLQLACGMPITPQPVMAEADGYAAVAAVMAGHLRHNGERERFIMVHRATYDHAWAVAQREAARHPANVARPTNQP